MKVALMFAGGTIDSSKSPTGRKVNPEFDKEKYKPIFEYFAREFPQNSCDVVPPRFALIPAK